MVLKSVQVFLHCVKLDRPNSALSRQHYISAIKPIPHSSRLEVSSSEDIVGHGGHSPEDTTQMMTTVVVQIACSDYGALEGVWFLLTHPGEVKRSPTCSWGIFR